MKEVETVFDYVNERGEIVIYLKDACKAIRYEVMRNKIIKMTVLN